MTVAVLTVAAWTRWLQNHAPPPSSRAPHENREHELAGRPVAAGSRAVVDFEGGEFVLQGSHESRAFVWMWIGLELPSRP